MLAFHWSNNVPDWNITVPLSKLEQNLVRYTILDLSFPFIIPSADRESAEIILIWFLIVSVHRAVKSCPQNVDVYQYSPQKVMTSTFCLLSSYLDNFHHEKKGDREREDDEKERAKSHRLGEYPRPLFAGWNDQSVHSLISMKTSHWQGVSAELIQIEFKNLEWGNFLFEQKLVYTNFIYEAVFYILLLFGVGVKPVECEIFNIFNIRI